MTLAAFTGTFTGTFVLLTGVFLLCACLAGQAQANGWKPLTLTVLYAALIALAHRFLLYALNGADILGLPGLTERSPVPLLPYLISAAIFCAVSAFSYRATQASRMVSQYPWLYRRQGLLGWREKGSS